MQKPTQLRYQDIPENKLRSKGFTSWSAMDLWVLGVSILLMLAGGAWAHAGGFGWGGAMIVFALIGVMVLPFSVRTHKGRGRLYALFLIGLKSAFIILVLKRILWQANDTSPWIVRWLRSRIKAIPLKLGYAAATVNGKSYRFSLVHQTNRPLDHLLILADGGAFSSYDADQQFRATDELAAVINQIIAQSELKCGVSYDRITGPADPTESMSYFSKSMDPTVAQPEKFQLDKEARDFIDWLRQNAAQLGPVAKSFGISKSWGVIVITIRRKRHWKAARKGKLTDQELYDLPLIELGRDLIESLEASNLLKLKNVHNPGLAELGCLVRCTWDVVGIEEYFEMRAAHRIPTTDEEIDAIREKYGDDKVDEALQCWPQRIVRVSDDGTMLQLDDNWIQTIRVTEMPKKVRADQFLSLQYLAGKGVWTRNAMVGEAVSGSIETTSSIYNASVLINVQQFVAGNRVVQNPKWARRRRDLEKQTEQVSQNSVAQHFNMLRGIISGSERTTGQQSRKLRAGMQAKNFKTEVIDTEAEQVDAAISALFAFNRL